MPENMLKPSMLPVPNRFQYVNFLHTYLFICHLLHPTDFQYPVPRPDVKCFQEFLLLQLMSTSLLYTVFFFSDLSVFLRLFLQYITSSLMQILFDIACPSPLCSCTNVANAFAGNLVIHPPYMPKPL